MRRLASEAGRAWCPVTYRLAAKEYSRHALPMERVAEFNAVVDDVLRRFEPAPAQRRR